VRTVNVQNYPFGRLTVKDVRLFRGRNVLENCRSANRPGICIFVGRLNIDHAPRTYYLSAKSVPRWCTAFFFFRSVNVNNKNNKRANVDGRNNEKELV